MSEDAWVSNLVTNFPPDTPVPDEISFDMDDLRLDVAAGPAERRGRFRVDRESPPPSTFRRERLEGPSDGQVVGNVRAFRDMTPAERARQALEPRRQIPEPHMRVTEDPSRTSRISANREVPHALERRSIPTDFERLANSDFLDRWDDNLV
jgi:hypothetical protein